MPGCCSAAVLGVVCGDDWASDCSLTDWERRRGFERLLRKLLRVPSQPALLYFHVWQPDYMSEVFWKSAEMEIQDILAYYSVPSVSARNALYHLYMANATGFDSLDWLCGWHPNPLGHRWGPFPSWVSSVPALVLACPLVQKGT